MFLLGGLSLEKTMMFAEFRQGNFDIMRWGVLVLLEMGKNLGYG